MGKILHLIPDEKVTDQMIENFNSIGGESVFLIFGKPGEDLLHTKNLAGNVILFDDSKSLGEIVSLEEVSSIVLHSFRVEFARLILTIDLNIKVAWVVWGYDVYSLPKIRPALFADRTNRFLLSSNNKLFLERLIKKSGFLRKIYYNLFLNSEDYYSILFKGLKRVNYFCTYVKEDFDFFSRYYPNRMTFYNVAFSSIKQYLAGNDSLYLSDNAANIILGNSSASENNHLDAITKLSNSALDVKNIKIFVPLSYSSEESYKQKVLEDGKSQLKESFVPLLSFMGREEYIQILQNCNVGIFYHYRQQAMGNIIAMLFMGARIYLSGKNPIYLYFNRLGVKVFDFDTEFEKYLNTNLSEEEIKSNRTILESIFSEEVVHKNLLGLVNILS